MKTRFSTLVKSIALVAMMSVGSLAMANNQIVAVVDDSVILKSDIDQAAALFAQQLEAKGQPIRSQTALKKQVLEQLILRKAQLSLVKRYGVRISEQELNSAMLNVAQQAGEKDLASFQKMVDAKSPNSYARLRASMQEELSIQRLSQQMVMSRIKISDQDVDNFLKSPTGQSLVGTKFHVIHVRINGVGDMKQTIEQVRSGLQAGQSASQINQLGHSQMQVQAVDMGWKELSEIPTELAVRVSPLADGEVSETIVGRDASVHVLKLVARKANEERHIVPQYQTRHILVQPTTVISKEIAQQTINNIHQRLMNGEDFATLATMFSADSGSARDGGNLGWVDLGTMVPEFEAVMKSSPVGAISQPFQSQFGWHILQVQDTRQYDKTVETQQEIARQTLGNAQLELEMEDWLREVRSNAYIEIKDPSLR